MKRKGKKPWKVPLSVMIQQIQYNRGLQWDQPYSRIMNATGVMPTAVQLVHLGGVVHSRSAMQRYLRVLKAQAKAKYAEAVAKNNKREAQEIKF